MHTISAGRFRLTARAALFAHNSRALMYVCIYIVREVQEGIENFRRYVLKYRYIQPLFDFDGNSNGGVLLSNERGN